MSCGVSIMKFTLIFFNIIFLLVGIAGVGLGIWIAVSPSTIFELLKYSPEASDTAVKTSAYIFIAGCSFVLIVSALGIFGACTQNRCLLGFYGFFVILIFAVELAALITAVVYDQKFRDELKKGLLEELVKNYNNDTDGKKNGFTTAMDQFQTEFKCCGINSYTDYDNAKKRPDNIDDYPKSCHPPDNSTAKDRFNKGCYDTLRDKIKQFGGIIIGIVVSVLVFEIVLFIFAMCLCRHDEFGDKIV